MSTWSAVVNLTALPAGWACAAVGATVASNARAASGAGTRPQVAQGHGGSGADVRLLVLQGGRQGLQGGQGGLAEVAQRPGGVAADAVLPVLQGRGQGRHRRRVGRLEGAQVVGGRAA